MAAETKKLRCVVVGGGVIGVSTAFYLTKRSAVVTLVEEHEIAGSASGKAGGFLARDWCDGPLAEFAQKSFDLHSDLASELGAENVGYRRLDTMSVAGKSGDRGPLPGVHGAEKVPARQVSGVDLPSWVDGAVLSAQALASSRTSAQVHPRLFTRAMFAKAQERGATLVKARATGITVEGGVTKVTLQESEPLECDVVVMAVGPWSRVLSDWGIKIPRITGQKAHSICFRPPTPFTPHALFLQFQEKNGRTADPEIYPRPDGEVYCCGASEPPTASLPRPAEACYLPVSASGYPVIGQCVAPLIAPHQIDVSAWLAFRDMLRPRRVAHKATVYVAAGHSCWGILNAPATGLALSELILDGASSSVNLASLAP